MSRTNSGLTQKLATGFLAATMAAPSLIAMEGCGSSQARTNTLKLKEKDVMVRTPEIRINEVLVTENQVPYNLTPRDPTKAIEVDGQIVNERNLLSAYFFSATENARTIITNRKGGVTKPKRDPEVLINSYVEGDKQFLNTSDQPKETYIPFSKPIEVSVVGDEDGGAVQTRIYHEIVNRLDGVEFRGGWYASLFTPNDFGTDHAFMYVPTLRPVIDHDNPAAADTVAVLGVQGRTYVPADTNHYREMPRTKPDKMRAPLVGVRKPKPEIERIKGGIGLREALDP